MLAYHQGMQKKLLRSSLNFLQYNCSNRQSILTTKSCNMATNSVDIKERKNKLRNEIKTKLKTMTQTDKLKQTYINTLKLVQDPGFQKAKRVAIYLNMKNEVGTYDILKELLNAKKQVFIPLVTGDIMRMVKLNSFDELKMMPKSKWGIIQPLESDNRENCLETGGVELIVVPGVAFTDTNLRLGHGKGYYDRFLAENDKVTGSGCVAMGLAFNEQMVEDLPTHEHDFKLSSVIHPNVSESQELPKDFPLPPEPFTI